MVKILPQLIPFCPKQGLAQILNEFSLRRRYTTQTGITMLYDCKYSRKCEVHMKLHLADDKDGVNMYRIPETHQHEQNLRGIDKGQINLIF